MPMGYCIYNNRPGQGAMNFEPESLDTLSRVKPNVRDQRRRAVGAPLADRNLWELLAVPASGVTTRDDRCIA